VDDVMLYMQPSALWLALAVTQFCTADVLPLLLATAAAAAAATGLSLTWYRRTYQRAIVVPTHSLELIWKNYEAFENQTAQAAATAATASGSGASAAAAAKQFGSRVINEQRPRFQAARMAYRERKRKMEGIDTAALPVPPGQQASLMAVHVPGCLGKSSKTLILRLHMQACVAPGISFSGLHFEETHTEKTADFTSVANTSLQTCSLSLGDGHSDSDSDTVTWSCGSWASQ
jgi:hypothetical protein